VSEPAVSVVIPAYNEATRLPASLREVRSHLEAREESYEIVVVDDGSGDGTAEAARAVLREGDLVLVTPANRGKGHATRRGMLAARGALRLMTDADLSTPIEELARLRARVEGGADVAIASRALRDSRIEVRQPWYRENLGRLFNAAVRVLVVGGIADTQCGFKLFTARAARICFGASRLDGFGFDVETLHIARRGGLRIDEVAVTWRNDAASRVTLWGGMGAFADLLRIRWNGALGRYSPSDGGT
jgi:dolichyl-phosphate beta-glucosyltransferase